MFLFSTKVQLKILLKRKEFQFGFLVMLIYACFAFFYSLSGKNDGLDLNPHLFDLFHYKDANAQVAYNDMHRLWALFTMLYPFLIVLPFATSYVDDYQNRLLPVYISRTSRWSYYVSKLLAGFLGTALMVGLPLLVNLLLCNLFLTHNYNSWWGAYQLSPYYNGLLGEGVMYESVSQQLPFLGMYLRSPLLYNLWYLLIFSTFSGLLGCLVLSMSFLLRKWKVVLFLPIFALFQVLRSADGLSLSRAIAGQGFYFSCDPFYYVAPSFSVALSGWYALVFCLAAVGVILLFLYYGVKRELKSIQ